MEQPNHYDAYRNEGDNGDEFLLYSLDDALQYLREFPDFLCSDAEDKMDFPQLLDILDGVSESLDIILRSGSGTEDKFCAEGSNREVAIDRDYKYTNDKTISLLECGNGMDLLTSAAIPSSASIELLYALRYDADNLGGRMDIHARRQAFRTGDVSPEEADIEERIYKPFSDMSNHEDISRQDMTEYMAAVADISTAIVDFYNDLYQ